MTKKLVSEPFFLPTGQSNYPFVFLVANDKLKEIKQINIERTSEKLQ
jgi:hypothetical protein